MSNLTAEFTVFFFLIVAVLCALALIITHYYIIPLTCSIGANGLLEMLVQYSKQVDEYRVPYQNFLIKHIGVPMFFNLVLQAPLDFIAKRGFVTGRTSTVFRGIAWSVAAANFAIRCLIFVSFLYTNNGSFSVCSVV